jgi:hypothetical protein
MLALAGCVEDPEEAIVFTPCHQVTKMTGTVSTTVPCNSLAPLRGTSRINSVTTVKTTMRVQVKVWNVDRLSLERQLIATH